MNKNLFYNCPFLPLFLFLAGGIFFGKNINYFQNWYLFAFMFLFSFLAVKFRKHNFLFIVSLGAVLFFLGFFRANIREHKYSQTAKIVSFSKKYEVAGKIISFPKCKERKYSHDYKKGFKTSFVLKVSGITDDNNIQKDFKGRLQVFLYSPAPTDLKLGDILLIKTPVNFAFAPKNAHQFDYGRYLKSQGIYAVSYIQDTADVKKISKANVLYEFISKSRKKFLDVVDNNIYNTTVKGFLSAVILGQRDLLTDRLRDDFLKTGTVHVLAVSGLHLGIITMIIFAMLNLFVRKRKYVYAATLILIIAYAILAGLRPSVLRALIMVSVYIVARLSGRQNSLLNSLCIAGVLVLLANPYDIFSVGFIFSFTIVFFLITLTPKITQHFLKTENQTSLLISIKRKVIFFLSGCVVAQIAVWPLMLYFNNLFSLSSFVVNMLLIPLMYPVLLSGFLFVFFGAFLNFLIPILKPLSVFFSFLLIFVTKKFADISSLYFYVASFSVFALLVYYSGLICLLSKRLRKIGVLLIFVFIAYVGVNHYLKLNTFKITFLSLGKGEAAFINIPGRKNILIDAGSTTFYDGGAKIVSAFLKGEGVNRIDNFFISHLHSDHYKALFDLKNTFPIERIFLPDIGKDDAISKKLLYDITTFAKEIKYLNAGKKNKNPLKEIEVLSPPKGNIAADSSYLALNENSLVLKFSYMDLSGIFTGDAEFKAMEYLVATGNLTKVDFLKVPHHGGDDAFSADFYEQINPDVAVLSRQGAGNIRSLRKFLKQKDCLLFNTGTDGAVSVLKDKDGYRVRAYKKYKNKLIKKTA